ncbi:DUF397 domain-containing protein [Streptomyces sp. ADMS]|nr:DUF397 domain-containing protein [Streptomyces sp. ADMS]MDW4907459.1 DUF397 domain-containing protein [Streptomyces sp. ADMS]
MRDSKTPASPHLILRPTTWAEFVAAGPGVPGREQAPQPPCA